MKTLKLVILLTLSFLLVGGTLRSSLSDYSMATYKNIPLNSEMCESLHKAKELVDEMRWEFNLMKEENTKTLMYLKSTLENL